MLKGNIRTNLVKIIAAFALMLVITPALAFAHGNDKNDDNNNNRGRGNFVQQIQKAKHLPKVSATNEFGVQILGDNKKDDNDNGKREDHHLGFFQNIFYNGEVTAVSGNGFTIKTNSDVTLTVDTTSAKIIRIPRSVIANSDIAVGDTVHITGTKVDGVVTASVVYDMSQNLKPAIAKGTVTAVTDNSITVQTKDDKTVTVNTDGDTKVVDQNGNPATVADIDTGENVKLFGLWDTVLHVFNALKIRLK